MIITSLLCLLIIQIPIIGGPPFYGLGRDCFALDYAGMDTDKLGVPGATGDLATKWIGGLAHELGHGLNAPHNKEHKTDKPTLGTALMGAGNYSYGKTPTYITNATSALFSLSQTFATTTRSDWYASVQNNLVKLKGEFRDNKIIISGKYTSSLPVKIVNVYHDPFPAGAIKTTMPWHGILILQVVILFCRMSIG